MERIILYHAYHSSRLTTPRLVRLALSWGLAELTEALDLTQPEAREILFDAIWLEAMDSDNDTLIANRLYNAL
jgi:hypothetical protein